MQTTNRPTSSYSKAGAGGKFGPSIFCASAKSVPPASHPTSVRKALRIDERLASGRLRRRWKSRKGLSPCASSADRRLFTEKKFRCIGGLDFGAPSRIVVQ